MEQTSNEAEQITKFVVKIECITENSTNTSTANFEKELLSESFLGKELKQWIVKEITELHSTELDQLLFKFKDNDALVDLKDDNKFDLSPVSVKVIVSNPSSPVIKSRSGSSIVNQGSPNVSTSSSSSSSSNQNSPSPNSPVGTTLKGSKRGSSSSLMTRAKIGMVNKVVTSSIGRKALPKEMSQLLKSLRKIVSKVILPKKADDVEKAILKLTVKVRFLVDDKKVILKELARADIPLRQGFDIFVSVFEYYGDPRIRLDKKFNQAAKCFNDVKDILLSMLTPYLSKKYIDRFNLVFSVIGDEKFYLKVWNNADLFYELFMLTNSMSKYTQIHRYY
jgi:hypothetical protein